MLMVKEYIKLEIIIMSIKFDIFELKPETLLTSAKCLNQNGSTAFGDGEDDWRSLIWSQIRDHVNDESFPCIFARKVMAESYLLVTFVDGWETVEALDAFCACVVEYIETINEKYGIDKICPPLMAVFKPAETMDSLHQYSNASWYILQYLHYQDKFEWPEEIPADPDDPLWTFCFNKMEIFINITSPVLGKHKSRVLSDSLVFTIQPRTNFDIVAGKDKPFGLAVRNKIRERWMKYDGLESAHDLTMYGDQNNREWKQYFLYGGQLPTPARCPLNIKSK
jgi:uncharacterized protein